MLLALAALAMQAPAASQPSQPDPARTTVVERRGDAPEGTPPIRSRITRSAASSAATDPIAAMHLREWASCVVNIHRNQALALLATPLNSPAQTEITDRLTGRRYAQRAVCLRFRSMRVDNVVLRGAIAEALYRWEQRTRRSAGPLALPAVDVPAPPLVQMGRCMVGRDPDAVARLIETRSDAPASMRMLATMTGPINACMPAGLNARNVHPLALRGAMGEPYYLSRRTTAEPALATQPRS